MLMIYAGTQAATPAEAELLTIQDQWAKARVDRNVAFLERLYAKEFWITSMQGSVVTRSEDIGVFASGDMRPEIVADDDMKVTVYDGFAVVTGREHVKGTYKGMAGDFQLRFTNVYVRRDGRWQMITHHSTPIGK
jgi:ketosteroid isomerase-like protein